MTPDPPSSPVETTVGLLGHCPACHSPMYGPCGTCISKANAAGTTYEVQRLTAEIVRQDATIGRLWAQLNEATNVPVCAESCAGQSWTGVDQAWGPGKVWRCDTCGRIVSQHVSNPMQAADDRRAL